MLTISDRAVEKVREFRTAVEDGDSHAMWVEITGVAPDGGWSYNLSLKPTAAAGADDARLDVDGLPVVVPACDLERLRGAAIDWSDDLMHGGLTVDNPNRPAPLAGDVAERTLRVIEDQINPAIEAHGGRAELVTVDSGTAYVRLGGGCVGCGMATVTLDQGIERAITDAVPEVERVVDVTDHASGTNPYYAPATT